MTELVPNAIEDPPLAIRGRLRSTSQRGRPITSLACCILPEGDVTREHRRDPVRAVRLGRGLSAHRSLRSPWAGARPQDGYPTLRFDLPGSGDSGGSPREPERLDAWTSAPVDSAASSLRCSSERCRAHRRDRDRARRSHRCLPGNGARCADRRSRALGGAGAGTDVHARAAGPSLRLVARGILRGAEAVHTFCGQVHSGARRQRGDRRGSRQRVVGFLLTAERPSPISRHGISCALPVPDPERRRVLLLETRLGPEVDRRLREHFEPQRRRASASRTGPGYGTMMVDPQFAKPPWGGVRAAPQPGWPPRQRDRSSRVQAPWRESRWARPSSELDLTVDDAAIRETPVRVRVRRGLMS